MLGWAHSFSTFNVGDRDNDSAGLGDWYPSKKKFPDGLKPLADHVHDLGMKFGVWFEPESVGHSHTPLSFIIINASFTGQSKLQPLS